MASWMVRTGGWTAVYVSLTARAAVWAVSGLSTNRTIISTVYKLIVPLAYHYPTDYPIKTEYKLQQYHPPIDFQIKKVGFRVNLLTFGYL